MAKIKKFKKYGWIPDTPDHRDYKYSAPRHIAEALPSHVDLRPTCPDVYDQGELGSCTANAIGGNLEFEQIKQGMDHWTPSRLFIYYNERVIENSVMEDAGAMIRDGIKSLVRWGFCPETMWPYDISKFTRKPPVKAYREAAKHKVRQYARVGQNLDDLRACLAGGNPVIYGFSVYESFETDEVSRTGVMVMPGRHEQLLGGHAVLAVGYDDDKRWFIVRNSWGTSWGDNGYFYMPYEFIVDQDLADDFWTVTYVV